MKNPIEQLADKAYSIYLDGGKLTKPEAAYFINSLRMLDLQPCYRILKTAKERYELQKGE